MNILLTIGMLTASLLGLATSPSSNALAASSDPNLGKKERPWLKRPLPSKPFSVAPDNERLKALKRLMEKYPTPPGERDKVIVHWDPRTGYPSGVYLDAGHPQPSLKPAREIAMDFLTEWMDLLGIDPDDLGPPAETKAGGATVLNYVQNVNGIPLFSKRVKVTVEVDGRVSSVDSDYFPALRNRGVPTKPNYTAGAAAEIVARFEEIQLDLLKRPLPDIPLAIDADCGFDPYFKPCEFFLVWVVRLPQLDTGFLVDALNGKIIREFPTVER